MTVDSLIYGSSTASIASSVVPEGSGLPDVLVFNCRSFSKSYPTMKCTLPGRDSCSDFKEVK